MQFVGPQYGDVTTTDVAQFGFSPNVQEILEKFEFRNHVLRLSKADAIGILIEELLSPDINLISKSIRASIGGRKCVVVSEPDSGLRDTEQVPLLEEGGSHSAPRGAAARNRCLIRPGQRQDRLQSQLHPLLVQTVQTAADAHAR